MGRRKKSGFENPKMLSSRVEQSDYDKFEDIIREDGKNVQEVINLFVRSYVSGTVRLSGSTFVGGSLND